MIVYAVVDDALSPDFPLGVELERGAGVGGGRAELAAANAPCRYRVRPQSGASSCPPRVT